MRLLMTSLVLATACLVFASTSNGADILILARAQSGGPEAQLLFVYTNPNDPSFEIWLREATILGKSKTREVTDYQMPDTHHFRVLDEGVFPQPIDPAPARSPKP